MTFADALPWAFSAGNLLFAAGMAYGLLRSHDRRIAKNEEDIRTNTRAISKVREEGSPAVMAALDEIRRQLDSLRNDVRTVERDQITIYRRQVPEDV